MAAKKDTTAVRVAKIRKALAFDDVFEAITVIREVIVEKGREQEIVVRVYACILETNSAGLTILFDRFTPPEIAGIERALAECGAARTASDLRTLQEQLEKALRGGLSREDAIEDLPESEPGKTIDRMFTAHVDEMEAKLLAYCREHVEELAAG